MNLHTTYLGLSLRSPVMASASPLSESVDNLRHMEDAGAGAVVLYSLFEEQLRMERLALYHHLTYHADSHAEAASYFPEPAQFHVDSRGYLNHITKAKAAVTIPVIASLNGATLGAWVRFARQMQDAGADAIELNLYSLPTDMTKSGAQVEQTDLEIVDAVCQAVTIPVAVKLSPFFSNMAYMARRFDEAGASALVLFNRFYQPDIDLELLEVRPNVLLSTPQALRLPLRWIAILYGRIDAQLAATGGIHSGTDVVKALLVGATVTMMASALLRHGIDHIRTVEDELRGWMRENEYETVGQMRGAMSQLNVEDPSAYERAQYMRAITNYRPPD